MSHCSLTEMKAQSWPLALQVIGLVLSIIVAVQCQGMLNTYRHLSIPTCMFMCGGCDKKLIICDNRTHHDIQILVLLEKLLFRSMQVIIGIP